MKERMIIFVCTGNTCRSPMAEAVLRSEIRRLKIENAVVFSAGIEASKNGNINSCSAKVLSENGLSIENFVSRTLNEEMLKNAYAIVCMTDNQRDILMDMRWNLLRRAGFAEIENNVYSFSELAGYEIPDPFGRELDFYRLTYRKIAGGMSALIAKLFPETTAAAPEPLPQQESAPQKKPRKPRAKPRKRVAYAKDTDGKKTTRKRSVSTAAKKPKTGMSKEKKAPGGTGSVKKKGEDEKRK